MIKPRVRVFLRGDHEWELEFDAHPNQQSRLCGIATQIEGLRWKVIGKDIGDIVAALSPDYQVDASEQYTRPRWDVKPSCLAKRVDLVVWELTFDAIPTGACLDALARINAQRVSRGPLVDQLRWKVADITRATLVQSLKPYFEMSVEDFRNPNGGYGTKDPKTERYGHISVKETGDILRVTVLNRDLDDRDRILISIVFPDAYEIGPNEYAIRVGSWSSQMVRETLAQFYEVVIDSYANAEADADARARKAAEDFFRRSGKSKPDDRGPWTYGGFYGAGQAPPRPSRTESGDPYRALLESLPKDVLKKVYRLIAAEVHPDKGGTTEQMQKVNAAWDRIKKL